MPTFSAHFHSVVYAHRSHRLLDVGRPANCKRDGEAELSEETTRYQERVRTMWSERRDPKSSLLK